MARHARAVFVEDVFSDEGGSLTPDGREQAAGLAESLAHERVAAIFSSDYARAVQTAEIVAAGLGVAVQTRKSLREVYVGTLTGEPFDQRRIDDVVAHWHAGDLAIRFEGGESGDDVVARHRVQLEEIADEHRGETVLVVGHETALGVTVPALAGLPLDWARGGWDNAVAVALEVDVTGFRLP